MNRNLQNNEARVNVDLYRTAVTIPVALPFLGIEANGSGFIYSLEREEKTPSVKVYDDHLYDFSTGKYYDLIALVMKVLDVGFWAALEWIADRVELPRPQRSPEAQKRYESVQSISETYAQIFQDSLDEAEPALTYLEKRGISREVTTGKVGYLPANYKPRDLEAAKKAGLISKNGNFLFSNRLIIPIYQRGQIVSLYGRAVKDCAPEHRHRYPGTTEPSMPATLWNLDVCRGLKEVYLAECIIDGWTLVDRGFMNTIGLFGTQGFTDARVDALKKTSIEKIVLCFDSDSNGAGQAGALKGGEKLFRAGFDVRILELPLDSGQEKTDLNSYFQTHTVDDFRQLEPRDFYSCLLDTIPTSGTVQQKVKAVKPIIALVAAQGDELLDRGLLKQVRDRYSDLSLETLERKVKNERRRRPDHLPVGSDFLPDLYADTILQNESVIYHHEGFHFYNGGVYREQHELEIKRRIQQLGRGQLKRAHIEDALHSLKVKTYVRPESVNQPGKLNLKNGFIDLMLEKPDRQPHTPELLSTIQLSIEFPNEDEPASKSDCPKFLRFLADKLPDPKLRDVLQEMTGYLLTPTAKYQKGFVLIGPTRTGKSTFIKILSALIGKENRTNIPLERLGDQYKTANIDGKLANFSNEIDVSQFIQDGIVKAITGGDEITGERKFQQPYSFTPYCRLVCACNELPLSHDTSDAFFRRWIAVPFTVQTPEEDCDSDLAETICAKELPGVLLWALSGLPILSRLL